MSVPPTVSVVIPTIRRPQLLMRAIRGVFARTVQDPEVNVVVDWPDEPTRVALCARDNPRLVVITNSHSLASAGGQPLFRGAAPAPHSGRAEHGRAFRYGSPRPWHILHYVAFWVVPQDTRRKLRALFRGQRYAAAQTEA